MSFNLIPKPKELNILGGLFTIPNLLKIKSDFILNDLFFNKLKVIKDYVFDDETPNLFFIKKDLESEEFIIKTKDDKLYVYANTLNALYYSIVTLKQIFKNEVVNNFVLRDYPSLKIRGVMLDISRSKVPSINTLKYLVDMFSELRYNHMQLYVEGFSFEYASFKKYLKDGNYIRLNDYLELEKYANEHFIDLVPNENGFGHMSDWLGLDEFKDLAECPDGFYIWGATRPASTLNPVDERSFEFVKKLYADMIPHFKSKYFNMNLDEPFEIGHGKSKEAVEKASVGQVYIDFFSKLAAVVKSYGKIPMLWGDVLIKHQEQIPKLDKNCIFIDWGYNKDYDFFKHAQVLESHNVSFMLAPGTSSWSTIGGRYYDMYSTISNSCKASKKHHGLGVLVTDWGDIGHLQYLPVSYPGFVLGGLLSWGELEENDFIKVLEEQFEEKEIGKLIIELSKFPYLEGEYRDYGSRLFSSILWAEHAVRQEDMAKFYLSRMVSNIVCDEDANKLRDLFTLLEQKLQPLNNTLEKEELLNSLTLLQTLLKLNQTLKKLLDGATVCFDEIIEELKQYSKKHKKLWNERNIPEGYKFSNQRIEWLISVLICL